MAKGEPAPVKKFTMCVSQERLAEMIMNDPNDLEVEAGRPVESAQDVLSAIADVASTWPMATEAELRQWADQRGDDAGRAARSYFATISPALAAEVLQLREALREIADTEPPSETWDGPLGIRALRNRARAALSTPPAHVVDAVKGEADNG